MKDILAALLLVVTVIAGYLYVYPSWQDMQLEYNKRTAYNNAIEEAKEFRERLNDLRKQLNSFTETERSELDAIVSRQQRSALSILTKTDKILSDIGVEARDLSVSRPTNDEEDEEERPERFERVLLTFTMRGNYSYLKEVLAALEQRLPLYDVTRLSFNVLQDQDGEEGGPDTPIYDVTMQAYSLKE